MCAPAALDSTADHSIPATGSLKELTALWIQRIQDKGVMETALAHLEDAKPEHPFDEQHGAAPPPFAPLRDSRTGLYSVASHSIAMLRPGHAIDPAA